MYSRERSSREYGRNAQRFYCFYCKLKSQISGDDERATRTMARTKGESLEYLSDLVVLVDFDAVVRDGAQEEAVAAGSIAFGGSVD